MILVCRSLTRLREEGRITDGRSIQCVEAVTSNPRQNPLHTDAQGKSAEAPEQSTYRCCQEGS